MDSAIRFTSIGLPCATRSEAALSAPATVLPRLPPGAVRRRDHFPSRRPFPHGRALPFQALLPLFPLQPRASHGPWPPLPLPFRAAFGVSVAHFERYGSTALCHLVGLSQFGSFCLRLCIPLRSRQIERRAVGRSASSRKGSLEPTGRFRTMPGFAMAAAMMSSSSASFAKP